MNTDNIALCPGCKGACRANCNDVPSIKKPATSHWVFCENMDCGYSSPGCRTKEDAIHLHNLLCRPESSRGPVADEAVDLAISVLRSHGWELGPFVGHPVIHPFPDAPLDKLRGLERKWRAEAEKLGTLPDVGYQILSGNIAKFCDELSAVLSQDAPMGVRGIAREIAECVDALEAHGMGNERKLNLQSQVGAILSKHLPENHATNFSIKEISKNIFDVLKPRLIYKGEIQANEIIESIAQSFSVNQGAEGAARAAEAVLVLCYSLALSPDDHEQFKRDVADIFRKHSGCPEGWVMQKDFKAMTPETVPDEIREHSEDAANGYADGWNACRKAMLSAAPAVGEGETK